MNRENTVIYKLSNGIFKIYCIKSICIFTTISIFIFDIGWFNSLFVRFMKPSKTRHGKLKRRKDMRSLLVLVCKNNKSS